MVLGKLSYDRRGRVRGHLERLMLEQEASSFLAVVERLDAAVDEAEVEAAGDHEACGGWPAEILGQPLRPKAAIAAPRGVSWPVFPANSMVW